MITLTHRIQIYLFVQGVLAATGTFYSFSKFKTSITYLDKTKSSVTTLFPAYLETSQQQSLEEGTKSARREKKRCKLSSELSHQRPQLRETALITPFTSLYHHTYASKRVQVHAHTNNDILSLSLSQNTLTYKAI